MMYPRLGASFSRLPFLLASLGLMCAGSVATAQSTRSLQIISPLAHTGLANTGSTHTVVIQPPSSTYPPDTEFVALELNQQEFLQSWTEYNPETCADISTGTWTVTTPPMFGTLTFEIQNAAITSGDCIGTVFPFNAALYTWTSTTSSAPQDFFSLQWTTPDGVYDIPSDWLAELLPLSETTEFLMWSPNIPTSGWWQQTLYPTTINYAGVHVQEIDPGGPSETCTGGNGPDSKCVPDTCWYADQGIHPGIAPIDKVTSFKAPKEVRKDNLWGIDAVGRGTKSVNFYQATHPLPCYTSFPQQMQIQFATGDPEWYNYGNVNTLGYVIYKDSVVSQRAGKASPPLTWPPVSGTETGR